MICAETTIEVIPMLDAVATIALEYVPVKYIQCSECSTICTIDVHEWDRAKWSACRWPRMASQIGITCQECEKFQAIGGWAQVQIVD